MSESPLGVPESAGIDVPRRHGRVLEMVCGFKSTAAAEGPDDDAPTVAVLFDPESDTWVLRGDPYLWRALRKRLADEPMPGSPDEVARVLHATFEELTGTALADDSAEDVYREEFAHGGMSSGMISLETWRHQLVPTLVQRATTLLSA